jgi:hypothetical protein
LHLQMRAPAGWAVVMNDALWTRRDVLPCGMPIFNLGTTDSPGLVSPEQSPAPSALFQGKPHQ